MKPLLILLLLIALILGGCPRVQIDVGERDTLAVARTVGYNAAYWPLMNNPDYIPKVEIPLRGAIDLARDDGVDIAGLMTKIISYCEALLDDPAVGKFAPPIRSAVESFRGIMVIDLEVPENYQKAVRHTRAFLEGALRGLEDVKAAGT